MNRLIRGLLSTPLMCRLIGRRLITAYVVGRKSGRRYPVPAACSRRDGSLLVGFNKVGLDHDGEPIADDLHLAWAAGARLLVLTRGDRHKESCLTDIVRVRAARKGGTDGNVITESTALAIGIAAALLVFDLLVWRVVAAMFDRERLAIARRR